MLIKVESDLHLGFRENYEPNLEDIDVYVLCGDIDEGLRSVEFCNKLLQKYPKLSIVEVAGNHLYYSNRYNNLTKLNNKIREISKTVDRYYFLENDSVVINGIRFIGACLWTDFNKMNPVDMNRISFSLNDYKYIRDYETYSRITPYRINYIHQQSKKYIFQTLDSSVESCIVVSHHRPILSKQNTPLKYGYEVDLEDMFNKCQNLPYAWFSGHCHQCFRETREYENGSVLFLENSLGYPKEITGFSPNLVLEVQLTDN